MTTFDEATRAAREIGGQGKRNEAKDFVRRELLAHGRKLTRADLAVAVAYLDGLNWKDGYCYHGADALAHATSCCRRSVMSARKKLADCGFIVFHRVRNQDRVFEKLKVTFPHLVQFLAPPSAEDCTRGSAEDCTGVVQQIAPKPSDLTSEDNLTAKAVTSRQGRKWQASEDDAFARFWQVYPRKEAKPRALKVWKRLSVEQRERAIAVVPAFAAKLRREGKEQFTPYPSTWLNDEGFNDLKPTQRATPPADAAEHERNLARQFVLTEEWDRGLGPRPGEPGSKVSAATLAEIRASLRKPSTPDVAAFEAGGRIVRLEVPHAKHRA